MMALLARCSRLVPTSWAAGYALPLRLIVGYGFMEHGFAKLARGPDSCTPSGHRHPRSWRGRRSVLRFLVASPCFSACSVNATAPD
jgi:hypothetical protein